MSTETNRNLSQRSQGTQREKQVFSGSSQIQFAAGLPPARTDPVDEWLQAAPALSIEIFLERPPRSFGNRERLGCLNGSIRRSRGEPGRRARPPHRWLDDDHSASTKAGRRTEAAVGSIPP